MRCRFVMWLLAAVAFVVVLVVGCRSGQPGGAAEGSWLAWWEALSVEEKLSHLQPYMVEGAQLSADRPAPHLLSEQEVMIRAAEYAVQQGYLDPAHPIYEEVPELATARVAEPIFLYYGDELQQGKVNGFYTLYATTKTGKVCLVSSAWGTRIARIDEPLHLHEKLAAAKARAAAGEPEPAVGPTEPVKITPVEF